VTCPKLSCAATANSCCEIRVRGAMSTPAGLKAEKRWTVSHFATSIKLLKSGLAFAFVPKEWIEEELKTGYLMPIPLSVSMDRHVPL